MRTVHCSTTRGGGNIRPTTNTHTHTQLQRRLFEGDKPRAAATASAAAAEAAVPPILPSVVALQVCSLGDYIMLLPLRTELPPPPPPPRGGVCVRGMERWLKGRSLEPEGQCEERTAGAASGSRLGHTCKSFGPK